MYLLEYENFKRIAWINDDEFLPVRKRRIALIIDDNFVCGRLKSIIIFRISGNIYFTSTYFVFVSVLHLEWKYIIQQPKFYDWAHVASSVGLS